MPSGLSEEDNMRKKKRPFLSSGRPFGILLLIPLLALILTGCKSSAQAADEDFMTDEEADGDIVLTWAVFETDNYTAEMWQAIIDAFEADNPGICQVSA